MLMILKYVAALSVVLIATLVRGEVEVSCVLLDGSMVSVRSLAIAGDRVTGDGVPAGLTLDDLQRIRPALDVDDIPFSGATMIVELRGGSQLWAKQVSIADEKARIEGWGGQPLVVPVDLLRSVRLDIETERAEFNKSLAAPAAELDRLFIKNDRDQLDSVTGLVESLDAEQLKIDIAGQIRTVPRGKIFGIVFAQPVVAKSEPKFLVKLREGSRLGGEKLSLASGKGTLTLGAKSEALFDWSSMEEVTIRSSRMAFLSDLTPAKEEQTPIVTLPLPAQRDKSVSGGRLNVGVQFFDKGFGVHAHSALNFSTEGKWDLFVAKIGLDSNANGKGDCVFQVLADGKSIFQQRRKGHEMFAEEIKLPITGCRELTLLVEPGVGLDLADHANWCDARLIKNK